MNVLISGENAVKKKKLVEWDEQCQKVFDTLQDLCTSTPILAYADYKKEFQLHTDACEKGLGGVLYQKDKNGLQRVIAYASRSLSHTERNYPGHKLEFLALKWAVTDRFHEYLYGGKFDVFTDNNPLTYILTSAKLDACGQRWVASLTNYDFRLFYKTGKSNVEADALSQIPADSYHELESPVVKTILKSCQEYDWTDFNGNPMEVVCKTSQVVEGRMTNEQKKTEQSNDDTISQILWVLKNKEGPNSLTTELAKQMYQYRSKLILRHGLLYRKYYDINLMEDRMQFVLPKKYHVEAMEACHDSVRHLGIERTLSLLRDRFYWSNMAKDVENYVKTCPHCLRFKKLPEKATLNPIKTSRPLELVHIDYLTIEAPKTSRSQKDVNVLIVTDHFARYAQAFVTPNQKASTVAKTLWDKFFVHYGFPEKILSDQGRNFESKLLKELCILAQIKKRCTTPYRPEGNGSCERCNRTLISMLGTLSEEFKSEWVNHVNTLTYAYNCMRSNATGFSPYYLLYGRHPLLPIDIEFGVMTPDLMEVVTLKYVHGLQKRLDYAFKKAADFSRKEALRSKQRYDKMVKTSKLEPGDLVLVRRKGFQEKHKILNRWESDPYEVIKQREDGLPVFVVVNNG